MLYRANEINEAQIKISHLPTQSKAKEFSYLHYLSIFTLIMRWAAPSAA